MSPFFSVIIPTFNRAQLISRAIDSVLKQSFKDYELIVVDDGSTDGTGDMLKSQYGDKLKYLKQVNSGVCTARNKGAEAACGKFLVFLDSDDWLSENCLHNYEEVLAKSSAKLVLGMINYYDANLQLSKKVEPKRKGDHFGQGLTGSFSIDRKIFLGMGGYDTTLTFAENSDLFLRIRTDKQISVEEITTTTAGGVCIFKENKLTRKKRYTEKKFRSIKYILEKHKLFFETSPKDFINFNGVLAFSALYSGLYREARAALVKVIKLYPGSVKTYFQLVLFCFPTLAKMYYGRS